MADIEGMTATKQRPEGLEVNAERRSQPRSGSTPCPHCGMARLEGHHFRDSGELPADEAKAAGFCPVLAERRRSQVPAEISRIDARIAEAIAAGWTEEEPNYAAALAAEADWGAQ